MRNFLSHSLAILLSTGALTTVAAKVTVGTLSLEYEAQPGETYDGILVVSNDGDATARVTVYQTDYLCFSDGSNQFGEPGQQPRSNARWITFSPRQLDVLPHQRSSVYYVTQVPADSTLMGTYWSLLMVEEQPATESETPKSDRPIVRQVVRYGVQLITHIRGTGQPSVQFTASRLVELGGDQKELQVDVENTGERWIVPTPRLELYDMNGRVAGHFQCPQKRIFPGTSVRFQIKLGSTPGGKYKALVVLDNGDQQLYGAKYDLEF